MKTLFGFLLIDWCQVIPDEEMGNILLNIFGKYGTPFKRYCRMMYWMPKFKGVFGHLGGKERTGKKVG